MKKERGRCQDEGNDDGGYIKKKDEERENLRKMMVNEHQKKT